MHDPTSATADTADDERDVGYTIRQMRALEHREPLTEQERAGLDAHRASPAVAALTAFRRKMCTPEHRAALAAHESMPPGLRARYDHSTFASTRRDPLFQRYVRQVGTREQTRTRACARPAGRPAARRTGSSSTTASADPGGSDPEPPRPPRLPLWRHPRYGATNPALLRVLLRAEAGR